MNCKSFQEQWGIGEDKIKAAEWDAQNLDGLGRSLEHKKHVHDTLCYGKWPFIVDFP